MLAGLNEKRGWEVFGKVLFALENLELLAVGGGELK